MIYDTQGFAARLSALREKRGLTQEELAERSGLSAHYIGNLEQSVRKPSLNTLFILCQVLGSTPDALFQDSITEEMRSGLCVSPEDCTLRDPYAELAAALEGWLEPDDYCLSGETIALELTDESPFLSVEELSENDPL